MANHAAIATALRVTLNDIQTAMDQLEFDAKLQSSSMYALREPNGVYPAHQLLAAKAHCLQALAALAVAK